MELIRISLLIICIVLLFIGCSNDEEYWESANKTNTVESYQTFVQEYPESEFTDSAKNRIDSLAYENTSKENTEESYFRYYETYPNSKFAKQSRSKAASIAYENVKNANVELAYLEFINKYSDSEYDHEARTRAATLRYEKAFEEYTEDGFQKFIADYPNSEFVEESKNRIDDIRNNRFVALEKTFISYKRLKKVFNWNGSFKAYLHAGEKGSMEFLAEGRLLTGSWVLGNLTFIRSIVLQDTGITLYKGTKMIYPEKKN